MWYTVLFIEELQFAYMRVCFSIPHITVSRCGPTLQYFILMKSGCIGSLNVLLSCVDVI